MDKNIILYRLKDLFKEYPYTEDFFISMGISNINVNLSFKQFIEGLEDEILEDIGFNKEQMIENFLHFMEKMDNIKKSFDNTIKSITIIGGHDKLGNDENITLKLNTGEVACIVGPTGSGKSRLLGDIECLAQKDTPTGRQILINDKIPESTKRFSIENKLVAQLSQNMNFVMDLSVEEFITMHAESRMIDNISDVVKEIILCANNLAGEKFSKDTPLTQLSGGQSRSLMIADTALLSVSPIILIDEIENAGIDRKKAIELLVKKEKIVLMSTHDPILALIGDKRIVIKNGGINKIINVTSEERSNLDVLQEMDNKMLELRNHLRNGGTIDFKIS
ncbi:ABC transporter ATP-binding protein [Gottschalkia purinilytica]|uniref:ABC transporter ATP-binding protein n=1 Tax=Gottschalkia purinilytica TaxID=1503 RepID=A0A0L0WAY6_GOTPU|nr:ABC transporter ATP-binding protein [Gottschalkia purinilytica]KNF08689.1 ABC transporter ATP-binding protein [Gottschalkia purinilytica]